MRVGLITADLSHRHGWAHYSLEVAAGLARAGAEVRVLASVNSDALPGVDVQRVLPPLVPRARLLTPRLLAAVPAARAALRDCDVIHATVEPFALLAAQISGARPLFLSGVGSYLRINAWARPPFTLLYRRAFMRARVLCISHYAERIAREEFPGVRASTVPLAINAARFADLPASKRHGHLLLTVGGIKPRKGTLHVIRALAEVRKQIPEVRLMIAGSTAENSEYTRQVRAEIEALGLTDAVSTPGFVSEADLLAYYAAADVFVLPSINNGWMFEGFGLVHLEASAAGLPVIGTRDCGIEDAIDDGVTGLLVSQESVDSELPGAILRLLNDAGLRERMGQAGRERAQARTWDDVAAAYLDAYESAVKDIP
jgi:glycosyltransferase involved in cell wall biosynthesis